MGDVNFQHIHSATHIDKATLWDLGENLQSRDADLAFGNQTEGAEMARFLEYQ